MTDSVAIFVNTGALNLLHQVLNVLKLVVKDFRSLLFQTVVYLPEYVKVSSCLETTIIEITVFVFSVEYTTQTKSQLPQWAIIVIAVMSGLVILTGLIVVLVFFFTWFNRVR